MSTSEETVKRTVDFDLKVQQLYTKNSLFESTTPASLLLENLPSPSVILETNADVYPINKDKGLYEAVLTLLITAKYQDNLLWRIQYQQAGLYTIKGLNAEQEKMILNTSCMNQLYSYASAEITRLITQGGFAPIYLDPLNFEQLYRNRKPITSPEKQGNGLVHPTQISTSAKQSDSEVSKGKSLENPITV